MNCPVCKTVKMHRARLVNNRKGVKDMAEIIEWANRNGWTIKLTVDEALSLKSDLVSALSEGLEDVTVDLENK